MSHQLWMCFSLVWKKLQCFLKKEFVPVCWSDCNVALHIFIHWLQTKDLNQDPVLWSWQCVVHSVCFYQLIDLIHIQIPTGYVVLIWLSTTMATASWSTVEGTLRVCCCDMSYLACSSCRVPSKYIASQEESECVLVYRNVIIGRNPTFLECIGAVHYIYSMIRMHGVYLGVSCKMFVLDVWHSCRQ